MQIGIMKMDIPLHPTPASKMTDKPNSDLLKSLLQQLTVLKRWKLHKYQPSGLHHLTQMIFRLKNQSSSKPLQAAFWKSFTLSFRSQNQEVCVASKI